LVQLQENKGWALMYAMKIVQIEKCKENKGQKLGAEPCCEELNFSIGIYKIKSFSEIRRVCPQFAI
jgi:hypothetical protein